MPGWMKQNLKLRLPEISITSDVQMLLLLSCFSRVRLCATPQTGEPTRLPRPWDSPGKNTGVGCHFLLQCLKVKSEREVAQSCPTLHDPMDGSPPGSSIRGIFQARVLEWGAITFSDLSSIWSWTSYKGIYFLSLIPLLSFSNNCSQASIPFAQPKLQNHQYEIEIVLNAKSSAYCKCSG